MEPTADPRRRDARRPTPGVSRRTASIGAGAALATGLLTGWLALANHQSTTVTSTTDGGAVTNQDDGSSSIPRSGGAVFGTPSSGSADTTSGAS